MTAPSEDIPMTELPGGEGTPRLAVEDLRIVMAPSRRRPEADVVDEVSFTVQPGRVLGLVGESGSGKTTVALALLGLVKRGLAIGGGKVLIDGQDILSLSEHELQKVRGQTVAYVPQDPGSALNPVLKVGTQLREVFAIHGGDADRLTQVMAEAGLEDPGPILASYPHQLSGGQQQRVALAMAFACRPRLIVLDEPTTGLDVTTQRRVLDTVRGLCRTYQVAAVYISHDLAVVAEIADHVAVMYSGRLIEIGAAAEVFASPAHPYTRGLMRAIPSLEMSHELLGMAGSPPRPGNRPAGCSFRPRCEFAIAECELREPPAVVVSDTGHAARCVRATEVVGLSGAALLARERTAPPAQEPVLTISGVSVSYTNKPVLREISLDVGARKAVAIVGTSGSGKTTLARCVVGLHKDWTGTITFGGRELPPGVRGRTQDQLRKIQFVAQNPYGSLNPRQTIGQIIGQPLAHFTKLRSKEHDKRVGDALTSVALRESFAARYPDELSGGERQRVALARALVVDPELLVCDEITSALDVSVQAAIVELLLRLQAERGLALLFITHNLPLVRSIADDVTVISAGEICERGPVTQVLTAPSHAYTRQLLADVPSIGPE
ncbi:MAG TPA: ABC transporter ATP-binding protein [Streptosporangiaceae bacterium]|nr:ABC transporter ATP-binding protein [Streptosporangiaceae bacterium]